MSEIIYDDAGNAVAQIVEIAGKHHRVPPPPTISPRQQLRERIGSARTIAELRSCLLQILEER